MEDIIKRNFNKIDEDHIVIDDVKYTRKPSYDCSGCAFDISDDPHCLLKILHCCEYNYVWIKDEGGNQ